MPDRRVFRIGGPDAEGFLQGLITNDVAKAHDGLVYAALLTPQGKFIADFFLVRDDDTYLLDAPDFCADDLVRRLGMYKLRANVQIDPTELSVHRGLDVPPPDGFADPRHPELGWRAYRSQPATPVDVDWTAIRVTHCIPETGIELNDGSYILEAGFEALNGVDFSKGCYVGQEVTARMKHKTELRKGLRRVAISGNAPIGTDITVDGKSVGQIFSQSGDTAIAYLRLDRVKPQMKAADARVSMIAE